MNIESPRQLISNTEEQDGPSATKYESPKFFVGSGSPVGSKRKSNSDDRDMIGDHNGGDSSANNHLVNDAEANQNSRGQE